MQAREAGAAVLLEPWYHFELEVPGECVGRALSDVTRMGRRVRAAGDGG